MPRGGLPMACAPARSSDHRPSLHPPNSARQHSVQPPPPPRRATLYGLGVLPSPDALAAWGLAAVAASDDSGLRADDPRRGAVARPPHVLGRRDRYYDA